MKVKARGRCQQGGEKESARGRRHEKMFWQNKAAKGEEKGEKLSGPREIPGFIQDYLATEKKISVHLVKLLKAVLRRSTNGQAGFQIRVFDDPDALANNVQVTDYTSLDQRPELVLFEGWFDERAKQVNLEEKKKVSWETPILTQPEIQQKIEALKTPGDLVFFYMGRGSSYGGPLGMGAAVIELNPDCPSKKQKKYVAYRTDVIDMLPVGKGRKVFESDKPKEIANWVKDGHHKRIY
jgi:hypothetical protein